LSDFSILFFNIAADSNIQSWTKDEKTERKRGLTVFHPYLSFGEWEEVFETEE